jgi:hypothetical protein
MIYEDRDDCYSTIHFSYTGDGEAEIFAEKIQKVDLYVFDENHTCVLVHTLSASELAAQSATVLLKPGRTYRAVAVGNANVSLQHMLYEGTASDTRIYHPVSHPGVETGDQRLDSHDPLYHGAATLNIPIEGQAHETVTMSSSHYDVSITVIGYVDNGTTRSEDGLDLDIEHKELPTWLDFENRHSKHADHATKEAGPQHPRGVVAEGNHVFEYNVLRDLSESTIHLYYEDGEPVLNGDTPLTVDVAQFAADNNIDLDRHEVVVPIEIEFKSVGITVTIPSWATEPTDPIYE